MKIKIDNEFKNLIPPLTKEEYEGLKESIKEEGVREPLIVWNNILLDGHNRKEIADGLSKEYQTKEKKFKDRNEAIIWIVGNQLARRNISPYNRVILTIKKCEIELKKEAKERKRKPFGVPLETEGLDRNLSKVGYGKVDEKIGEIAGVSRDTVSKVKYIEKNATKEEKEELHNPQSSINKIYTNNKKKKEKEDAEKSFKEVEKIPFPKRKYNTIYADPPWKFWGGGWKNQAQHYHCEKIEDIKNLKDKYGRRINDLSDENCILFLWVTYPILPYALEVIESWGFKYSTVGFTWVKTTKKGKWHYGLGYWTRANPELCLIATKGKPTRKSASIPNLIVSPVQKHSKKPDIVRNKIIELVGDLPKIELFAREKTKGWDVWGDEVK